MAHMAGATTWHGQALSKEPCSLLRDRSRMTKGGLSKKTWNATQDENLPARGREAEGPSPQCVVWATHTL